MLTVEQAAWLANEDLSAAELLYAIQDWLGQVCEKDIDMGYEAFYRRLSPDTLTSNAQRMGYNMAQAAFEQVLAEEREMDREATERY